MNRTFEISPHSDQSLNPNNGSHALKDYEKQTNKPLRIISPIHFARSDDILTTLAVV